MPAETRTPKPLRTNVFVALVAVVVRLAYVAAHARSALFDFPLLDARWYDLVARAIATGAPLETLVTGFRPLGYPALLSLLYRLEPSSGLVLAQLAQHALGVATALVVAGLARRLTGTESAALAAGFGYALAPVPLFFEGELLAESLFVALLACFLLTVVRVDWTRSMSRRAFGAAGWLGLAAAIRPNALVFAFVPLFGRPRRLRPLVAFGVGLALIAFAATLVTSLAAGVSPVGGGAAGVNLYLGNKRGADGLVPRQDFAVTYGGEYRDSVEVFARAAARAEGVEARGASLDRYWLRRTAKEIAADPLGRLRLLGRKAVVTLWNGEVPNNRSFAFAAHHETPLLGWLPARFGLLFALAVAGWFATSTSPTRTALGAFALLHTAVVVAFFVADRYRLPLYLAVATFAGAGASALVEAAGRRDTRKLVRLGAFVVASALLSFVDWTGARRDLPGEERDLFFRSLAKLERGDAAGAAADASRAARLAPEDAAILLQLGRAELGRGELDAAEATLSAAERRAPHEPRIPHAEGIARERRGDLAGALVFQLRALHLAPDFAPARVRAAWLQLLAGRASAAATLVAPLGESPADDPRLAFLRSELARRAGDETTARAWRATASRLDTRAAAELERQLAAAIPDTGSSP